jgi:hypothetical protein
MADPLLAGLELFATGLPAILALVAFLAARRYAERRFAFVGAGLLALGALALLGLVANLSGYLSAEVGLGLGSVLLLLVAEIFLFLSLVTKRATSERSADG